MTIVPLDAVESTPGLVARSRCSSPILLVMIVTSAVASGRAPWRAIEYGAAETITKLVDFDQLKAQLGQLPA